MRRGDSTWENAAVTSSDGNGQFSVDIPNLQAGEILRVTVQTPDYYSSDPTYVTVAMGDHTPPVQPTVHEVSDQDTVVTGVTEPGARVFVNVPSGEEPLNSDYANQDGTFSITIPQQAAVTILSVTAMDAVSNVSQATFPDK